MSARGGRLLVLAGHDPTGGAGVDADRRAARRFGLRATTVVTAETDQDGTRVHAVRPRPATIWLREARAALRPRPLAIKTGLLPGAEHVRAVVRLVVELRESGAQLPVVVDPVLAASAGEPFLDAEGLRALVDELVPLGVYLTPNVPEVARLCALEAAELEREPALRIQAASELVRRGAAGVVVKGGHGTEDPLRELYVDGSGARWHERPRVDGAGLHGSGCRFASAFAAGLARGEEPFAAAGAAGRWLGEILARREEG